VSSHGLPPQSCALRQSVRLVGGTQTFALHVDPFAMSVTLQPTEAALLSTSTQQWRLPHAPGPSHAKKLVPPMEVHSVLAAQPSGSFASAQQPRPVAQFP
jgi:hypothetical protein